jgi:hypothetical protein
MLRSGRLSAVGRTSDGIVRPRTEPARLRRIACTVLPAFALCSCNLFGSNTWRATVVQVEGQRVCTVPFANEKDPGWANPLCLDEGLVDHHFEPFVVEAGLCVEMHNHHPAFVAHKVVPCPP